MATFIIAEWRNRVSAATGRSISQPDDVLERFFCKVGIDASGCWLWAGARTPQGYGRFSFEGRPRYAHRLLYGWIYGALHSRQFVCHHCDCPACVNPEHFFVGDAIDNVRDRDRKGRGKHTIVSDDTEEGVCIALQKHRWSHHEIAQRYEISSSAVLKIARGHGIAVYKNRKRLTSYQEQELLSRVHAGEPLRSIARSYGITYSSVQAIAKRNDSSYQRKSCIQRKVTPEQEREILIFIEDGESRRRVAERYGLSLSGVRDILRRVRRRSIAFA